AAVELVETDRVLDLDRLDQRVAAVDQRVTAVGPVAAVELVETKRVGAINELATRRGYGNSRRILVDLRVALTCPFEETRRSRNG
ncbi:MAG TPA: hypothetical protein VH419_17475, partial [Nocardioidaceae bacterium]